MAFDFQVTIDSSSPHALADWWAETLGWEVEAQDPAFIQQMQTQKMPNVNKLARVGDYHTPTGGTMVYYAVEGAGQSVGYIVYLGQDGKVLRIE